MTIRDFLNVLPLLCAVLVGAGCASPEARIREQADLFAQLSPDDQGLIREGRVAIGFTPAMVRLAVGDPDQVWSRTDADGVSEVWSYTTFESPSGAPLYRGWYHQRVYRGDPLYPYYLGDTRRVAREVFKVSFRDGAVIAVEADTTR